MFLMMAVCGVSRNLLSISEVHISLFYEVAKLFNFLFIKNYFYKQEIFMSCYGGEKEVVVREINQIST